MHEVAGGGWISWAELVVIFSIVTLLFFFVRKMFILTCLGKISSWT
jgi:hypothetical protein